MQRNWYWGVAFSLAVLGCGGPREEIIKVKASPDPLAGVRSVLQRYADGQAVASEAAAFPEMIEEVRKASPAHVDVIEKGLNDIKKNPANRVAIAKGVLQKLPPPVK